MSSRRGRLAYYILFSWLAGLLEFGVDNRFCSIRQPCNGDCAVLKLRAQVSLSDPTATECSGARHSTQGAPQACGVVARGSNRNDRSPEERALASINTWGFDQKRRASPTLSCFQETKPLYVNYTVIAVTGLRNGFSPVFQVATFQWCASREHHSLSKPLGRRRLAQAALLACRYPQALLLERFLQRALRSPSSFLLRGLRTWVFPFARDLSCSV